jgi:bifunctional DNase/RNase
MEVRMDLTQIVISETREAQLVVLRERNGPRALRIRIGLPEALAVDRRVKGVPSARPYTHDLLAEVIAAMNAEIEKIVINDLREHTFYAKLVLRHMGEIIEVDSRPSDAIALGAGTETPIYVEDHVLAEAGEQ